MPLPSDVQIRGAGVIGLSLALELSRRGARVTVVDRNAGPSIASNAAAGMLAVEDPHNPPALLPLSRLSRGLYPAYLDQITASSGLEVPFQTHRTHQTFPDGSLRLLHEASLDPRQLLPALRAAALAARVRIVTDETSSTAKAVVQASGAWTALPYAIAPRKGQMLRVHWPADLPQGEVFRNEHVYLVPRTHGPQAGTTLLGATVEDAGFDTAVSPPALDHLRQLATVFLPQIADKSLTPLIEAWVGFRPTTPDGLPLLGALASARLHGPATFVATGHFRNGILLAPATAVVMADLLEGRPTSIDLAPFSPARFLGSHTSPPPTVSGIRPGASDNAFGNLT